MPSKGIGWPDPAFVGDARVRVLTGLQGHLLEAGISGRPRLVFITGGRGTGKTRILREFYRSLAATYDTESDPEAFWSPELEGDVARIDARAMPDARWKRPPFYCLGLHGQIESVPESAGP